MNLFEYARVLVGYSNGLGTVGGERNRFDPPQTNLYFQRYLLTFYYINGLSIRKPQDDFTIH